MKSNEEKTESLSIYAKLLAARQAFHQIDIKKTGYNQFQNFKYFELADFLLPAMNCLAAQGLIPIVSFTFEYATMTVHDTSKPVLGTSEMIVITSPMSSAKLKAAHEIQNLGAVETYQRRYLWLTLMECVESDPVETAKPAPEPATPEQIAAMYDYMETDYLSDGQKAWIKMAADKITHEQAAYVLEKAAELEAGNDN
jgi:hypothetical protein